jgi:hypothetical protein
MRAANGLPARSPIVVNDHRQARVAAGVDHAQRHGARKNSVRVILERLRPHGGRALPRFRASVATPAAHGRLALLGPGGRSLKRVLRRAGGKRLVSRAMELTAGP